MMVSMKRWMMSAAIGLTAGSVSNARAANPFAPGDLAIYEVTNSSTLTSAGANVAIAEYSPTGTLVQTINLGTLSGGGNNPLVASGSATSEGELSLSANGQDLLIPGYDAPVGTTSIANSSAAVNPREIGEIDAYGNINTSTTLGSAFSGNNIRSVASVDGNTLFAGGATTGVVTTTLGGNSSTIVAATNTQGAAAVNLRQLEIYNNQLYASSATGTLSTSIRIGALSGGVSTATGQTINDVAGIVGSNNTTPPEGPYSFAFTTLGTGTAPDTLYVADNQTGDIEKFTLSSGTAVAVGSIALSGVTGLVEENTTNGAQLYATTATSIYAVTDTSGLNGTLTGSPSAIASVPVAYDDAFRGIAFAPSVVSATPEPTSIILLFTAGPLLLAPRRRKAIKSALATSSEADRSTL